jgi:acetyl-CoA acetyltransferase
MKDVAIVSFAQWSAREEPTRNEVEMLIPVVAQAIDDSGVGRKEIGFTCSGSCDYLAGAPFAFVMGLDAVGAWPPIRESHVEMDGAWALYEAWVRLQHGDVDTALVYSFGKSSLGDLPIVLSQQMDPYYVAPLWPDSVSIAALQARAWLDAGHDEGEMAAVAARSRRFAQDNQWAQVYGDESVDALLTEPYVVSPLRKHDIPPISDGATAIVLAAGDRARDVTDNPVWIRGIEHRIEAHGLGVRDLAHSPSTKAAGEAAGVNGVDVAELHAPFSHQELILRTELGLGDDVRINPSGGALTSNPMFSAGGIRIGEAAKRIWSGEASKALGHATSGPALQQNLVCVMASEGQGE